MTIEPQPKSKRFAIAVSFPGEHREFVLPVVERLADVLGRDRVFYDEWYEHELVGGDGDLKLRRYYREQSDVVVPFFSEHYRKPWCQIEWHATRAMLLDCREDNAVVPVQLDGTHIEGWEKIDFAIQLKGRTAQEIADVIIKAYHFRHPPAVDSSGNRIEPPRAVGLESLRTYGHRFAGRQDELALLDRAWFEGRTRIFCLHAEGGAGKTRVAVQWLNRLRDRQWGGAGGVFVHSFYSQGSDERRNATSELFFEQALGHFGYTGPPITDAREKARELSARLVDRHALLVLDGLEPLQHPPAFDQGRLKDPAIAVLLRELSAATFGDPAPALCLVTSRQPVVELRSRTGSAVVQRPLDRLDAAAGIDLLRQFGVGGTDAELAAAVEEFRGHAYSLTLLGGYLRDAMSDDPDIRRRFEIPLLEQDREHGLHARHLFAAYVSKLGRDSPEATVLRLLGFFDRPAARELMDVLRAAGDDALTPLVRPLAELSPAAWNRVLSRLKDLRLIDFEPGGSVIDSHPLLREYFAEQLRGTGFQPVDNGHHGLEGRATDHGLEAHATAWTEGHRRLYEHLCSATEHRPETLDGLQPLYQAVAHGCLAGMQQQACDDVYFDRILRGTGHDGFYSTKKLGAIGADLGAVACFFDRPWTHLSPNLSAADQAWLLNEAALRLRALGRLTEALEPMRAGLEMAIEQEDWKHAAVGAGNLSELELTLGQVSAAIADAEQSVTFADRSQDAFWRMGNRTTLADAVFQAGRGLGFQPKAVLPGAGCPSHDLFREAEKMQAERQPEYPRLYSLWGFRYCDLLLSGAERAAWHVMLRGTGFQPVSDGEHGLEGRATDHGLEAHATTLREVTERATLTLEWVSSQNWLLDIALDHLTLGRAALYQAILSQSQISDLKSEISSHLTAAVDGLRASGQTDDLPRGLLTRSWYLAWTGDAAGAAADLDEAWEIAERGPMPLFQADILLTYGRLRIADCGLRIERLNSAFPDPQALLTEARRLIGKHGYHRRDGELEDAEQALQARG